GGPSWAQCENALDPGRSLAYLSIYLNTIKTMSGDPLSATFKALADPTRRAILARLSAGESSVLDLAAPFAMSLPAVSQHLKVLEQAGLISRGREAQWRPCRLEASALKEATDWLDTYRRFWEGSFDRLDRYLEDIQSMRKEKKDGDA